MRATSLILAGLIVGATAAPSFAQALLTGASTDDILNLARGYGSATLETQPSGDPRISGRIEGIAYRIEFMNCANGTDCEDVIFYSGFKDNKPTVDAMQAWNVGNRFSKAFIDEDGDAAIEWDVNLEYGVSSQNFDANIAVWAEVLKSFAQYVGY